MSDDETVDPQQIFTKNGQYWQPILENLKKLLANDPYIKQVELDRKLLYAIFDSEGEDLIKEDAQEVPGMGAPATPPGGGPAQFMPAQMNNPNNAAPAMGAGNNSHI